MEGNFFKTFPRNLWIHFSNYEFMCLFAFCIHVKTSYFCLLGAGKYENVIYYGFKSIKWCLSKELDHKSQPGFNEVYFCFYFIQKTSENSSNCSHFTLLTRMKWSPPDEWRRADRQQVGGQVLAVVDASVHGDEPLQAGLVFHVGVVQAGVQHDDGKRQDVAGVCCRKQKKHSLFFSVRFSWRTAAIKNNDFLWKQQLESK